MLRRKGGVEIWGWRWGGGAQLGGMSGEGGGDKCTISLAMVWQPVLSHASKREQIKASSFDEYKTESPAEKHSPSNHPTAATATGCCSNGTTADPPPPAFASLNPAPHKMKGEWKQGERGTESTDNHNKSCFGIAINIRLLKGGVGG